ncbi:putative UPF0481 protein At3g02645 [Impatiens glandulifera]|uniref:putative UPF0481 protein At3g02645 n=1 Tax=Impatiens glandulifera TaxID=253017 RepID=UPI001FB10195|nr:putative UPF0481 protein At3g02645 [Impatiens glandulifera]
MALSPASDSRFSHSRWVREISKILEKEVWIDIDIPVSIFRVPKTITAHKPEAYVPHIVGLGPYRHFQEELYEMERAKLATAARLQKQVFHSIEFKDLVHELNSLEYKVRACYHKYLDIDGETLTWVMAIDSMFLLEYLYLTVKKFEAPIPVVESSSSAHLLGPNGRTFSLDSIIGDVMLLENQIPIFFLKETLGVLGSSSKVSDEVLPSVLIDFCKIVSPIKDSNMEVVQPSEVWRHAHLLDLLYHLVTPKLKGDESGSRTERRESVNYESDEESSHSTGRISKILDNLIDMAPSNKFTAPIKSVIPMISNLVSTKKSSEKEKIALMEEIMIPTVTQLVDVGIQICPTNDGVRSIRFDVKERKFYLPIITLNNNSEVIMRNLVAYEASIESGPLVLVRYMELMHGIIDSPNDAMILRKSKVIINSLKNDEDAAELFNGVTKSIRLTTVPHIDKAIQDVNKYFNNVTRVRIYRRMKHTVYRSWKMLTVITVILLTLMMILQSFCSIYSCPRIFNTISSDDGNE